MIQINAAARLKIKAAELQASTKSVIGVLQKCGMSAADAKQAADGSGSPGGVEIKTSVAKKVMEGLTALKFTREDEKHDGATQTWFYKGDDIVYFEYDKSNCLVQVNF
jgi:hypothetical protein